MDVRMLAVVIANEPDRCIAVLYKPGEPIFYLMKRISDKLGEDDEDVLKRELYLTGTGALLEKTYASVDDYDIFGKTLIYRSHKRSDMMIYLQTLTGKTLNLPFRHAWTINDIKRIVQKQENISPDQQWLVYEGRYLEDEKTLQDYGIPPFSTLHLIVLFEMEKK